MTRTVQLLALVALMLFVAVRPAWADDRGTVADTLAKIASGAESLAKTAKASDDKAIRKKLALKATELGEDLDALVRRTRKDVPLKTIAKEVMDLGKDVTALIDLVDEAEDKAERKSLRAQATVLEQQLVAARKMIDEVAAKDDAKKPVVVAPPAAMSAESFKQLVGVTEDANTDAQKHQVVAQAGQANWFTAQQIGTLMDLINTEAVKVNVASTLWPHLVDPKNGFLVFGKLELEGSKAELRRRVGAK